MNGGPRIPRNTTFPLQIRDISANRTITGIVTTAVVDALLSIPQAGIAAVMISFEQMSADIEVEFHRVSVEKRVRKQVISADTYVAAMYRVSQSNYPPDIETLMIQQLANQLKTAITGSFL